MTVGRKWGRPLVVAGAIVSGLAYASNVWSSVAFPWRWRAVESLVVNFVRLGALVSPPLGVMVMLFFGKSQHRRRALGILVAVPLALGGCLSASLYGVRAALEREVTYPPGSEESLRYFQATVVPILGDIAAENIEVQIWTSVRGGLKTFRFKTRDIESLRKALRRKGWVDAGGGWYEKRREPQKPYLLRFHRERDSVWSVEIQDPL